MANFNDLSVQDLYFAFDSLTKLYFRSFLCRMATAEPTGLVVFIFHKQEQLIFKLKYHRYSKILLKKYHRIVLKIDDTV